jgi:hypothetical protein
MPTTKPRIMVTLDDAEKEKLVYLSEAWGLSQARTLARLIREYDAKNCGETMRNFTGRKGGDRA